MSTAIRRKAKRHAVKATIPRPVCKQCGEPIATPRRLATPSVWARIYCGGACKQAAWRERHGE